MGRNITTITDAIGKLGIYKNYVTSITTELNISSKTTIS